jgi:hypothetical protein
VWDGITKVELLGHQSHWFAFFGKPGRCTRTMQKRCPVGACITTQRSRRSTMCAPSFSRRATSAGISSVQVHTALVIDALNLHNGFVRRGLQHPIIAAATPMVEVHGTAEHLCPEAGRLVHVRSLTIDQEGAETLTVHVMPHGLVWTKLERLVVARKWRRVIIDLRALQLELRLIVRFGMIAPTPCARS